MTDYFKISKFFLYATALTIAIVTTTTLFPFIVGKYTWFRTTVDISLLFFVIGIFFHPQGKEYGARLWKLIKSPLGIAVSAFTFFFLLACLFGVNPSFSFWSNFERGEGGFQILHLYIFFLLLSTLFKEEKDWSKMLWWTFGGAVLMILYGVAGNFGWQGFIGDKFSTPGFRFAGSIGNSSYVAAFLGFMIFYVVYFLGNFWKNWKSTKSIILYVLFVLFFAFFFLAGTRGAFLGFLAAVLVFLFHFAFSKKAWRKWVIGAGALLVLLVILLVQFKDTSFVKNIPGSRVFDLSFSAETFKDRRIMWGMAWEGFKERPILGWGPENYIQIFDQKFDVQYYKPGQPFGAWFDRAHSVYFDYIAETGILGLLGFLSMFTVFFIKFFFSRKDTETVLGRKTVFEQSAILAIPVAYLVQGIVLFDVLPMYFNTFLFLAFAMYLFQKTKHESTNETHN